MSSKLLVTCIYKDDNGKQIAADVVQNGRASRLSIFDVIRLVQSVGAANACVVNGSYLRGVGCTLPVKLLGESSASITKTAASNSSLLIELSALTNELRKKRQAEFAMYKRFSVDDNYHSNAIEGSHITIEETRWLVANADSLHSPTKGESEILDYKVAQEVMLERYKTGGDIDSDFVLALHAKLLRRSEEAKAGWYRYAGIDVTAGFTDVGYARGRDVSDKMKEFFHWWSLADFHADDPLTVYMSAIEFKYRFLRIHPFCDGNGKMSRLLLNLILLTHRMMPLIINVSEKDIYMRGIRLAQEHNDFKRYAAVLLPIYVRELKEYVAYVRRTR